MLAIQVRFLNLDGSPSSNGTGGYRSDRVCVWDLSTRRVIFEARLPSNELTFAPDSKSLVACSVAANEAHIWEIPSGRPKPSLKGHVGGMTHVTFSPDGRTLATGGYDGRIKLWNMATSQEVATIPHAGTINSLSFSPDGRTLAVSHLAFPGIHARLFRAPLLNEIEAIEERRGASQ